MEYDYIQCGAKVFDQQQLEFKRSPFNQFYDNWEIISNYNIP